MQNNINFFMQEALKQAELALAAGEIPVGAVIVNSTSQEIIAKSHNMVEKLKNPTLHAEIIVINQACHYLDSKNLSNCDLYVTLEPCAMCAAAISQARIRQLFYAAADLKQGAVEHGVRFFTSPSCFHRPAIYLDILAEPSTQLLKTFFKNLRVPPL